MTFHENNISCSVALLVQDFSTHATRVSSCYPAAAPCTQALTARGFDVEQYLLSPVQLGIPNTRLRYYCLASKRNADGEGTVTAVRESLPWSSLVRQNGGVVPLRPLSEYLVRAVVLSLSARRVPPEYLGGSRHRCPRILDSTPSFTKIRTRWCHW